MDSRQLVLLAVQASVLSIVFGFGLGAGKSDFAYLFQRPGLLLRSLLAVLVIMPILAAVLVWAFDVRPTAEVALVALAISPMPPLLPRRDSTGGGNRSYALALMVVLALLSIVTIPLTVELLQRVSDRPLGAPPGAIARIVLTMTLAPLLVGMTVRAMSPGLAERVGQLAGRANKVLIPLAVLALLAASWRAILAATGEGTILALLVFVVAGFLVGHLMAGRHHGHALVLALTSACRHPAIALALASANFPDEQFPGTILLYVILNAVVGLIYLVWMRGRKVAITTE
jgi:bile acid:Na+ symporter, BASS family